MLSSTETLTDELFDIAVVGIKLKRKVEMYQWKKYRDKIKSTNEETDIEAMYRLRWSEELIDSGNYPAKYKNPTAIPIKAKEKFSNIVKLGMLQLSDELVKKIDNYQVVKMARDNITFAEKKLKGQPYEGGYFFGDNPRKPKPGELKVTLYVSKPMVVSVIAKQSSNRIESFKVNGKGEISILKPGKVAASRLLLEKKDEEHLKYWLMRALGFVLVFGGVMLIILGFSSIEERFPLIRTIRNTGIIFISAQLSVVILLLTISISWLDFRPLVSGSFVLLSVLIIFLIRYQLSSLKRSQI